MSGPVQGEFPRHVVRRPDAHDLREPRARRVGAMSEGEVREDQCVTGGYWLRLSNHIPRRREPSELPSETLLKPAVVSARRAGRKDRVASAQLQTEAAPLEDALRSYAEMCTPRGQRNELAERAPIEPGVTKQSHRSPQ